MGSLKIMSALAALLFCGCSATIVYAPKIVTVTETGPGNAEAVAEILGSDLTGAQQTQEAQSAIDIPAGLLP